MTPRRQPANPADDDRWRSSPSTSSAVNQTSPRSPSTFRRRQLPLTAHARAQAGTLAPKRSPTATRSSSRPSTNAITKIAIAERTLFHTVPDDLRSVQQPRADEEPQRERGGHVARPRKGRPGDRGRRGHMSPTTQVFVSSAVECAPEEAPRTSTHAETAALSILRRRRRRAPQRRGRGRTPPIGRKRHRIALPLHLMPGGQGRCRRRRRRAACPSAPCPRLRSEERARFGDPSTSVTAPCVSACHAADRHLPRRLACAACAGCAVPGRRRPSTTPRPTVSSSRSTAAASIAAKEPRPERRREVARLVARGQRLAPGAPGHARRGPCRTPQPARRHRRARAEGLARPQRGGRARAQLVAGIAGELERSLEAIDGILWTARVHLPTCRRRPIPAARRRDAPRQRGGPHRASRGHASRQRGLGAAPGRRRRRRA